MTGLIARIFRTRPYPALRLFGRPIRQPDLKAVDPEPAHSDVVVLRVVEPTLAPIAGPNQPAEIATARFDAAFQAEWDANVAALRAGVSNEYRPVCSHEGLNEWGPPQSVEQLAADIRAITIPAMTIAEIVGLTDIHPMLRQIQAVRAGTVKRDSKGRFLPASKENGS